MKIRTFKYTIFYSQKNDMFYYKTCHFLLYILYQIITFKTKYMRVTHVIHGKGTVESHNQDYYTVNFDTCGKKTVSKSTLSFDNKTQMIFG